ncbi:hypothetical protein EAX62_14700 [Tessaracoccus antarcticus]|uniref:MucB/RseB N-terminal domain-containing protein n=2 Tax=Tessaracoccus antarcticus TaxID=2479848 RepID=A0A3M0G0I6_9ACTN|nr:hypothetical protein EAX62_14700 [Tessaracoccus antarcticus]
MLQSSVAAITILASVLAIAFLVAPEPQMVASAVKQAREQFSLSATAVSVNESVGAVLFAHERGASFGPSRHQSARPMMVSDALPITRAAASAMLEGEGPTHSGMQRVYISAGDGGFHEAQVRVDEVEGEGTSLVVLDATGQRFMSWFVPSGSCCQAGEGPPWTFWKYRGSDQVAGRWADVIEARDEEKHRVARWWVDPGSGLVLWSERYGADGAPTIMSGFKDIQIGKAHLAQDHVQLVSMNPVSSTGSKGWCTGLPQCPASLAGLPLVTHASSSSVRGERSMRLFYSDGFRSVSVVWSEGQLPGAKPIQDHAAGFPDVAVWQVGDGIVSVASNGSPEMLQEASSQLPGEQLWDPSVLERIGRGLSRLAGIN